MKLIANETDYALHCINNKYIDKRKPYKSIRTVVRYLNRVEGIEDIDKIYEKVKEYVDSTGKIVEFTRETIIQMKNEETPYNELEHISFSSNEMYEICNNSYPHRWKKVLFTMLVFYKVKKAIYPDVTNKRITSDISTIMKDAHVSMSTEKRFEMFRQFEKDGYIEIPNGGSKTKYFYLNYIDEEPQDELIVIEDFFDFYLYFEQYVKGGRLIYCQECGKLVLTNVNRTQYCKKCQREKQLEQQKVSMEKSRKK